MSALVLLEAVARRATPPAPDAADREGIAAARAVVGSSPILVGSVRMV